MSRTGQNGEPADYSHRRVLTQKSETMRDVEWARHRHEDHELLWGTRGMLAVETDDGFFAVPSAMGTWIPAGMPHRVHAVSGTGFYCTYLSPQLGAPTDVTSAVTVDALARELFLALHAQSLSEESRLLAEQLVVQVLRPTPVTDLDVPMPVDDRALRIAHALTETPADGRSLDAWGRAVGASGRTLSRLFTKETGMTFADWRTALRMRAAVELMAADMPVGAVARRVGYATPSAFVQAFRRRVGRTPGSFTG